jgi:hypothetical protein
MAALAGYYGKEARARMGKKERRKRKEGASWHIRDAPGDRLGH